MQKRLAYLSGAARVSTHSNAATAGPRAHVLGVIQAFERLGWQVSPFIVGDMVPSSWLAQDTENNLRRSYTRRVAADVVRQIMAFVNGPRAASRLIPVDLAYERFGAFQGLGRAFQKRGVPWILETNALLYREGVTDRSTIALTRLARRAELAAYRSADVIVCISDKLRDLLIEEASVPPFKVLVVPNGVDVVAFDPLSVSAKRVKASPVIGFSGSLSSWQGIDLLLLATAELGREGINFNIVVVGDGPMKNQWTALASKLGLESAVTFVGQVSWDQIPSYIAGFDLCYSGQTVTRADGMVGSALKLYEYLAMGKPVIASAVADAVPLIRETRAGWLFPPQDLDGLKAALRAAYAARSTWHLLSASTRETIVRTHSWDARVAQMIRDISHVLSR